LQKLIIIPAIISSWRIAVLPLFFYLFNTGNITSCLILLAFSAATDFFDGYLARKLKVTSRFGAYYDAVTDFILMIGIFAIFSANGYYPIWLLLLITASFIQFLASSLYAKKLYDPVGRYIGSALYIGIVLTLIFPTQATFSFVEFAFVGFFLISLASRTVSLARKQD
jgi:phosphatidylglycerophosphate synthase